MAWAHIPDQVLVFTQPVRKFSTIVHRPLGPGFSQSIAGPYEVLPAYPVCGDATDRVKATARRWANREQPETLEPNLFTGVRIVGYEERGNGGRAWKVIDSRDRLFDLREDILLDALVTGTAKEGLLDGEYTWIRFGTQMTLVRVGSQLHRAAAASMGRKLASQIRDLVPGKIYLDRGGHTMVWLGPGWWVTTVAGYYEPPRFQPFDFITGTYRNNSRDFRALYPEGWWFDRANECKVVKVHHPPDIKIRNLDDMFQRLAPLDGGEHWRESLGRSIWIGQDFGKDAYLIEEVGEVDLDDFLMRMYQKSHEPDSTKDFQDKLFHGQRILYRTSDDLRKNPVVKYLISNVPTYHPERSTYLSDLTKKNT